MKKLMLTVAAGAVLTSGCGGNDNEPAKVVTETVTQPAPAAAPATAPGTARKEQGSITVPNVVGKDHQFAQDTMQSAGLYNLREEDATGQGRLLLYDRNWTTVRQDPPAGTKAWPDTTITLYAKKDDEIGERRAEK